MPKRLWPSQPSQPRAQSAVAGLPPSFAEFPNLTQLAASRFSSRREYGDLYAESDEVEETGQCLKIHSPSDPDELYRLQEFMRGMLFAPTSVRKLTLSHVDLNAD